jgi:NADPH-dependent 2,4-dienoyl-CoA reductase/sulfur reductase-like enzyme
VGPELTVRDHPEMYAVGDIAAITDAKTKTVLPQLGSVALQSGEHAGETIARPIAGKATKPFKYRDKGTMATVGRGAAVLQMMGGRSVGTLHLAPAADQRGPGGSGRRLGGAGMTHQRAGRITVGTDEERDLAGAGKRGPRRHDVDSART